MLPFAVKITHIIPVKKATNPIKLSRVYNVIKTANAEKKPTQGISNQFQVKPNFFKANASNRPLSYHIYTPPIQSPPPPFSWFVRLSDA